jgi:hypothetical protein
LEVTRVHSRKNPVDSLTLRVHQTNSRNEVTYPALSVSEFQTIEQVTSRKQGVGKIFQEANAGSNVPDMLTWKRSTGR